MSILWTIVLWHCTCDQDPAAGVKILQYFLRETMLNLYYSFKIWVIDLNDSVTVCTIQWDDYETKKRISMRELLRRRKTKHFPAKGTTFC